MTSRPERLKLRFGGALVEQLGAQLYPSATATVAELISNSWDADAANVWVNIPFDARWTHDAVITVVDDGNGMSYEEAQNAYLIVGRKRRVERGNDLSDGGRRVHGRKGIGKLAAFGTATILECVTKKASEITSFRLDFEKIRKLAPTDDYMVDAAQFLDELSDPAAGKPLISGTRITLTGLLLKRSIAETNFTVSMSRRFALDSTQMKVFINGTSLPLFSVPTAYRFPQDGVPDDAAITVDNGWAIEELGVGREVRWWIGFTEDTIRDDGQQGISVLTRGKLAQRPFKFERGGGVTGQLGQEYLVGEVAAEWLDEGLDTDSDLIQSNRDQIQFEDARLADFIEWGQRRLTWALRRRQKLMEEAAYESFVASDKIKHLLQPFTKTEQRKYIQIARAASRIDEMRSGDVERLMEQVIDAQSERAVREMMERISEADDIVQTEMWDLVHQFSLIDARKTLSIVEARVATITGLEEALENGAKEVPEIHNLIKNDPWLIDPRYELLEDEKDMSRFGLGFTPETDDETGDQLDFLYVLRPADPANLDEAVVVEIKRAKHSTGKVRVADVDEVDKFHGYVLAVQEYYRRSSARFQPAVRGLMIAQNYTGKAELKRRSYESLPAPRMEFATWMSIINNTKRLHLGWLRLSQERSNRASEGQ